MVFITYVHCLDNFDGENKLQNETNESVTMGDLELNHNGKKGIHLENKQPNCQAATNCQNVVHFQSPYAMTKISEEERLQLNQSFRSSPLKSVSLFIWSGNHLVLLKIN